MKNLSAYTIAKNCSDVDDIKQGMDELRQYFATTKKPKDTAYIRFYKLGEKLKKMEK
jgi:hypothetical protein